MTREQVKQLSDEEVRIKVAELLGWTGCQTAQVTCDEPRGYNPKWVHRKSPWRSVIPNYPRDLNACHEMEKVFGCELGVYEYNLQQICGYGYMCGAMASARERCEAFILTREVENDTK